MNRPESPQHQTSRDGVPLIFRSVALPLHTFDYLKDFQRQYGAKHRTALTNGQALELILAEHECLKAAPSPARAGKA